MCDDKDIVKLANLCCVYYAITQAFSRTDLTRFTVTVDVEGSKRRARQIDKVSRKVFPVGFLLFNLLYWLALTIPTGISDTDEPES